MHKFAWYRMFFDTNLLEKLWAQIRNIFYCSLILAIGSYTHVNPPGFLRGTPLDPYWGYPLIAIALFLFLLNLVDALNQVLKINYNAWVKTLLIAIHGVLTSWLVMVMFFFRMR